jgi:diguanylate cyclase (GGDEF) domain protein
MKTMNRIFIRLYAFVCSVLLIGTLTFFAMRIYKNSKENLIEAEKNFKYIARFISASSEKEYVSTQAFLKKVQDLCALSGNIDKAMLADSANRVVFSWDAKTGVVSSVAYEVPANSFVLKPYSMSISVKNPSNSDVKLFNFSAVLKTVSEDVFYNSIRDCVFIFAAVFLCTLMLLIINYLISEKGEKQIAQAFEVSSSVQYDNSLPPSQDVADNLHIENKDYNLDDLADIDFSKSSPLDVETFHQSQEDTQPVEFGSNDSDSYAGADYEPLKSFVPETPAELFNPCGEQYFDEKLEYELGRATSAEQDLSLLLFRLIDVNQVCLNEIAEILLAQFKVKEMIFQLSDIGFAVIMHDANLEKSMHIAEAVYSDIVQIIAKEQLGIGITTRSSRLVSARRLYEEASSAVEKACENVASPIVAFRPDPKAYKDYLRDYT